ncbi:MAG: 4-(cytidine 5'-diphospho)-2-C-methyl-D-erythritol kinase, partial [Prevotella sp.]|nr:4-(cytidine 5'-diphospho)-2-C-methyl-D-erythritol kinase [Prevotella sp.]
QAGMGGGSSDAAYMIRLLNEKFHLGLSVEEMQTKAAGLGADCAFFIESIPAFARGIGDKLSAVEGNLSHLKGLYMAVVKTNVAVSTREAFARIVPKKPERCCLDIVQQSVETWRHQLTNDFETSVFSIYPELARIKERLYSEGAIYAQMTGSGSAIYALFDKKPDSLSLIFRDAFCHIVAL